MQADLSPQSHTVQCKFLIERLWKCYADNPIKKLIGECDQLSRDVSDCCHCERIWRRAINPRYGKPKPLGRCLPEIWYTKGLKKLKDDGVLIVRPEDCQE